MSLLLHRMISSWLRQLEGISYGVIFGRTRTPLISLCIGRKLRRRARHSWNSMCRNHQSKEHGLTQNMTAAEYSCLEFLSLSSQQLRFRYQGCNTISGIVTETAIVAICGLDPSILSCFDCSFQFRNTMLSQHSYN